MHSRVAHRENDELASSQSSWPTLRVTTAQASGPAYVPRTLFGGSRRYRILPAFPTSFYHEQPILLLSSVPRQCLPFVLSPSSPLRVGHKLSKEQLSHRQPDHYPMPYAVNKNTFDVPSYFVTHYQRFISTLVYQYNVDEAVLDYNLYRFMECYHLFIEDYSRLLRCSPDRFELDTSQLKYALEFYLQMDGQ